MNSGHFGDFGSKYFLNNKSYNKGIEQINRENPKINIMPTTKTEHHKIKVLDKSIKKIINDYNAEYDIYGQIVGGTRKLYEDRNKNKMFQIIVDCGFEIRTKVYLNQVGKIINDNNSKLKTINDEINIEYKFGDYIMFNTLLEAHHFWDWKWFKTQTTGVIEKVIKISREHGVFITIDMIESTPYTLADIHPKAKPDIISEEKPYFDIHIPESIS
jgi:hypothetical protein